jgi:phage terminase large subunit
MASIADFARKLERHIQQVSDRPEYSKYPAGIAQTLSEVTAKPSLPATDSVLRRVALLDSAEDDPILQASIREQCANDPSYFINNWCWTYDPRRKPSTIPFDMFPLQGEFIRWLQIRVNGSGESGEEAEDGLVEKSRDTGLSCLCTSFAVWQWLFVPGSKITFGSRKSNLVDELGNPDSLFEKIRITLRNLPRWMVPDHSDNELRFINRDNGSSITGEAGDQMGRGGRSTLYFLDEFAFVQRANRVDAAISENSDCKIYVSTPNGNGNTFARKRHSGQYPVFSFHWKYDERKNSWVLYDDDGTTVLADGKGAIAPKGAIYPWYEKKRKQLDPVVLAQEIDIDYAASVEGVTIPGKWVRAAVELILPATGPRRAGLDVANGGKNKNVFITKQGPVVLFVDAWAEGNTSDTAYKACELGKKYRIKRLNYDPIGVGAGVGGTLARIDDVAFEVQGVSGGATCTDRVWEEFDDQTSKTMFKNLRAEMWWTVRRRFEKTFEQVNGLAEYPDDELISIPNCPELISQLSMPLRRFNATGQIVIQSKEDMDESPDYADALVYAFAEVDFENNDWLAAA